MKQKSDKRKAAADVIAQEECNMFRDAMSKDGVSRENYGCIDVKQQVKKPAPVVAKSAPVSPVNVGVCVNECAEEYVKFYYCDVKKTCWQRLMAGSFNFERRLDLHGKTAYAAQRALVDFVQNIVDSGNKYALIIHGKGHHSEDGPMLKWMTVNWLKEHAAVQGFCSAQKKDGDTGALYVLFRLAE